MNCPQCNAPLPQDAKFCFTCGLALTGPAPEPGYSPSQPQPQAPSQARPLSQPLYGGQATSVPSQAQPPYPQSSYSEPPYAPPAFSQAPSSQPLSYPSGTYPSGAYPSPYYAPASQPIAMNPAGAWGAPMPPSGPPAKGRLTVFSWTPLIILAIALVALVGSFFVAAVVRNKSWSDGDIAAAIAAFGVGALALIVVIVQLAMRQWKRLSVAFNLLLVVVLALLGTGGIVFKSQVGVAQAQHYADAGDWVDALKQYALLANDPSCGHDCHRTVTSDAAHAHYEYGYQLEAAHNFQAAISQFEASLTAAPSGPDAVPAHVELSHAHFSYGLQFASQKQYLEAVSEFEQAVNAAPSGPYAHQAYLATATAYYAIAQQDLSGSSCQSAVSALETIVQNYADAPEAKQARAELAAPVKVTGTLTGYPTWRKGQAWLSTKARAPHCCAPAPYGSYSFSADYKTPIDPKTGGYTFARVVPGSYTLTMYAYDTQYANNAKLVWWYASNDVDLYFVEVGSLCPFTWPILQCDNLCN